MSEMPFIKFFPGDFLGGTGGLSPAERGVYITILCLIWENDGPVDMDDARLARRCGMPKAAFLKAMTALIDEGKLHRTGSGISNDRAEKTLMDRRNRIKNATHAANSRHHAQTEKNEENQCHDDATAMPEQCVDDAKPEARSQIEKREAKASPKKASRLSPDWVLPKSWGDWAISMISERSVRLEADKFRDYWTSKAGKDAAKLDWEATWRNWVRSAAERQTNLPKQSPDPKSERRAFIEKFTRQIQ